MIVVQPTRFTGRRGPSRTQLPRLVSEGVCSGSVLRNGRGAGELEPRSTEEGSCSDLRMLPGSHKPNWTAKEEV